MRDAPSSTSAEAELFSVPEASPQEAWFPQLSLRFLLLLIALSAAVLWILRAAVVWQSLWAQCLAILLVTIAASFLLYACFFLLALGLATISASLVGDVAPQDVGVDPGVPPAGPAPVTEEPSAS
jgi:hypothetical protein